MNIGRSLLVNGDNVAATTESCAQPCHGEF
jgi:hypothetical protein